MKTVFQSPPAYTFGTRHKNYGLDNTPGIIAIFSFFKYICVVSFSTKCIWSSRNAW
jgi:hypothetical protein